MVSEQENGIIITTEKTTENGEQQQPKLNYRNEATRVDPVVAQLYRCELDDDEGEEKQKREKKRDKSPLDPIFRANEHKDQFDPDKYLEGFYASAGEDTAMQVILFFLPGIVCRLPRGIRSMLDLGAGPTIYLPLALRHHVDAIFSSDYSPRNRQRLVDWVLAKNQFDWSPICRWICNIEANNESPEIMQQIAREKMKAVLEVDVHKRPVVRSVEWKCAGEDGTSDSNDGTPTRPDQFELVASVFCLEYSCEQLDGYRRALQGACALIRPGGWLIQGGIFHATEYRFGGKRFSSHFLTREHVFSALQENEMWTEPGDTHDQFHFITHDDIFLLLSRKKQNTNL